MGCFSPALRPHTAGKSGSHRDPWLFPFAAFETMRAAFRLRTRLVPYLAAAGRRAFDSGVLPVHALYVEWPNAPGVYSDTALHQHFFGDDIVVAPVTEPAPAGASAAELARRRVWVPPGPWVEWGSWALVHGGEAVAGDGEAEGAVFRERGFALHEVPLYSRPGTILPLRTLAAGDALGTAARPLDALTLWVFPLAAAPDAQGEAAAAAAVAETRTSTSLYEDDGVSMGYLAGESSETPVACTWSRALDADVDRLSCRVSASTGAGFAGAPAARSLDWRFIATLPPASVRIDGVEAPLDQAAAPDAHGDGAAWATQARGAAADAAAAAAAAAAAFAEIASDGDVRAGGASASASAGAGAGAAAARGSWAYTAATLSTWVHVDAPVPRGEASAVELEWPRGVRAHGEPLLLAGLPRVVERAKAAKAQMNRAPFEAFAVDVPGLFEVLGAPARADAACSAAAALAELAGLRAAAEAALAQVRSALRGAQPRVDEDVVARMEALLADALEG